MEDYNSLLNGLSMAAIIMTRHDKMKEVYAIDYKAVFSTRPNSYTTIFLKTNPKGLSINLRSDAGLTLCVNPTLPKD